MFTVQLFWPADQQRDFNCSLARPHGIHALRPMDALHLGALQRPIVQRNDQPGYIGRGPRLCRLWINGSIGSTMCRSPYCVRQDRPRNDFPVNMQAVACDRDGLALRVHVCRMSSCTRRKAGAA